MAKSSFDFGFDTTAHKEQAAKYLKIRRLSEMTSNDLYRQYCTRILFDNDYSNPVNVESYREFLQDLLND
jgi:hypothetical protein